MKLDAARWRQAVARGGADARAYLLHGPDEGAIAAAARDFARGFAADTERVDLDGATLRSDPGRLLDEAASLSLFGGARWIRVTGVGEESLAAVTGLLTADRPGNPVVLLAPGMRATARLAKAVTEAGNAGALIFYEPSAAEAERIAAALAHDLGLIPAPGTIRTLIDAAAGDRGVLTQELSKLALYLDAAPERTVPLTPEAIDAVGADRDEADLSALVAGLVDGEPAALAEALAQFGAEGASPIPWLRAIVRRLVSLAEMRAAIDGGEPAAAVLKRHRIFFREEAATLTALRRWTPAMLARAIDQIRTAERATMSAAGAGAVAADAAALAIARGVAGRR